MARSPVPQQTSRALDPGASPAQRTARERQAPSMPMLITRFMRSYDGEIRSNISRTWSGWRVIGRPIPQRS